MIKIVADSHIPFLKGVLEPFAQINYFPGEEIKNLDLSDTDAIIIRTRTKCNRKLLNNSGISFIASATIGVDHIDLEYCKTNYITVQNAPGCNSASVCQYIMSALTYLSKTRRWSLKDKTLGVVGHGNVGTKVAGMAKILGMNVIVNDPPKQKTNYNYSYVSIKEIIRFSDIISLHVPLTKSGLYKTFRMVNKKFLSEMSVNQILINSSRGGVVDEVVLKETLTNKKIYGVILDVWENEPCIDQEFMNKTIIGTPHIAGYSVDGKANGTAKVVNQISRYFNFGLENWYPTELPKPESTILSSLNPGKSDEELLYDILLKTYDIQQNNMNFKNNPKNFEHFRYSHPIRREYPFHQINSTGLSLSLISQLKNLGFIIT